ncbi:uncharacterized protein LOC112090398 isoform X2 [Morus notabilis]|uniref:uncharacterized protein LOC112090398 isoform X2 n=1 Tax=Morus notabilis TaxID=981085 RepID=UPI000CECEEDF|nr:uncharacterized protein LOC112090398 isoform X2 [Morus notabilis]
MGFKSVYRCLQEVFPQIDARILKAVAIERSKDADAAVDDILTEVLPYMTRQSAFLTNSPRAEVSEAGPYSEPRSPIREIAEDITHLKEVDDAGSCSEQKCTIVENAEISGRGNGATHADLVHRDEVVDVGFALEPRFIAGEDVEDCLRTVPSSEGTCAAVENAENSGRRNGAAHADLTHSDEVVDSGLGSEPRLNVGENVEDIAHTNGVFQTDNMSRRVVQQMGMGPSSSSSEPKCTAVKTADCSGLTNSGSHSDLIHLDEVVKARGSSKLSSSSGENSRNGDRSYTAFPVDLTRLDEAVNESKVSRSHVSNDIDDELGRNTMDEELILLGKTCEMKRVLELGQDSTSSRHEKDGWLNDSDHEGKDFGYSMANDVDQFSHERSCKLDSCAENSTECIIPSEFHFDPPVDDNQELQASGSSNLTSRTDCSVSEMGTIEDDFTRNSVVTQSGQICRIDILDEIIEDAKNNKKILFSAMESVINMMKEVELQERAAEQAKEEVANGGLDILTRVEELKQMLGHAKETNDMHAGEVHGEKAILATEMKELQSRLLCLSDERDKSLATLDEMRQTLEERLAAAEEMKKAAEQERLEKEELARSALAEQEAIMEKVVQESKLLEKEAEENSKLREFLVDRGRVVDMLQGEISVICQDVGLLKEKFDMRLPLSMSVSSSQTSCKLASSSSSVKSVTSVLVPGERESPKSPEKGSPVSSTSDQSRADDEFKVNSDDKELLEDGWDIFDKYAELDVGAGISRE